MQISKLIAVLLLLVGGTHAQQKERFALLPERAVKGILASQGTWKPTEAQVQEVEANLSQVSSLRAEGWSPAIHIDHPERYFRQYVPIVRKGQKMLYVNALCDEQPQPYWRTQLVVVADGATCYWQALYDPVGKTFSHLRINARA